jgi:hypothetical protein
MRTLVSFIKHEAPTTKGADLRYGVALTTGEGKVKEAAVRAKASKVRKHQYQKNPKLGTNRVQA